MFGPMPLGSKCSDSHPDPVIPVVRKKFAIQQGVEKRENFKKTVSPVYAGVQKMLVLLTQLHWTPAFAAVMECFSAPC
jgi:hypothetical protein